VSWRAGKGWEWLTGKLDSQEGVGAVPANWSVEHKQVSSCCQLSTALPHCPHFLLSPQPLVPAAQVGRLVVTRPAGENR